MTNTTSWITGIALTLLTTADSAKVVLKNTKGKQVGTAALMQTPSALAGWGVLQEETEHASHGSRRNWHHRACRRHGTPAVTVAQAYLSSLQGRQTGAVIEVARER